MEQPEHSAAASARSVGSRVAKLGAVTERDQLSPGEGAKIAGSGLGSTLDLDSDLTEAAPPLDPEGRTPGPRRRALELARGDEVGRYVILERVGAGGMGVVYAAWDPALDRKVALKLLHPGQASDHEQRLEREAQAMARLTHPNVIGVHDVGEVEGRVFMAMEFVEGQTLGAWIAARERSWAEIVTVMRAAGEGLAAAHAQRLVHRDFKPDNVMIGAEGRVRVMDFGLVRAATTSTSGGERRHEALEDLEDLPHMHASLEGGVLESQLTEAGSLLGTPAYMAPEQLRGDDADARADQFSFCVTLWRCLYGQRPFAGDTPLAVLFAVSEGRFAEPPADRDVPVRVLRVLERGLAGDPSARWPDMRALLDALRDEPDARRRPWLLGLVAVAVAVAAGTAAVVLEPPAPPKPCARAGEEIREDWSAEREAELAGVFGASELVYADETWARVGQHLDDWAGAWVEARRDSCEATELRQEQSAALLDLRMACLDRRRQRFAALLEVFGAADDAVIEKAVEAVEALPGLESCADHAWLTSRSRVPEDTALAEAVANIEAQVQVVVAMTDAGRASAAAGQAEVLEREASELGWAPTIAEVAFERGRILAELGDFDAAYERFERAYFASRRSGHDEISILAASRLAYVLCIGLGDFDRAAGWIEHGRAEAARVEQDELAAEVESAAGILAYSRGSSKLALEAFERSIELQGSTETSDLATAHINIGSVLVRVDPSRTKEAFAHLDHGLAMLRRTLGSRHPTVAVALSNYATVHGDLRHFDEAASLLDQALELQIAAAGEDHPMTGLMQLNLSSNLVELGREDPAMLARALDHARASERIHRAVFGDRHRMVAESLRAIGKIALVQGEAEAALRELEAAESITREQFGPDYIERLSMLQLQADCHRELGNSDAAIALLEEILAHDLSERRVEAVAQRRLGQLIRARDPDRADALEAAAKPYFDAIEAQARPPTGAP